MTVFFSHQSALAFWRHYRELGHCRPQPFRMRVLDAPRPSIAEVADAARCYLPSFAPKEVLVGPGAQRRRSGDVAFHRMTSLGERNSFVALGGDVFVATPALMFVQMAPVLERAHLLELAYELCGTYALSSLDMRGFCSCEPLLTPAYLRKVFDAAPGHYGSRSARRAASLVLPNAASPRESAVAMLLSTPRTFGGYGLPAPELNHEIALDEKMRKQLHRMSLRTDLYWKSCRLALEYESHMFHSGKEAYERDSRRRNDLKFLGVDVMTLTNAEISSRQSMDKVALNVRRSLGLPPWRSDPYVQQRIRLRSLLLDAKERARSPYLGGC